MLTPYELLLELLFDMSYLGKMQPSEILDFVVSDMHWFHGRLQRQVQDEIEARRGDSSEELS